MTKKKPKMKDFIANAKTYIDNAYSDPYIKEQILSHGYDDKRFEEGRTIQQKAWKARERKLMIVSESKSLNKELRDSFRDKEKLLTGDIRLLKDYFFRDKVVREKLNLRGVKKRSMTVYFERARTLYDTLLKEQDILDQVVKLNLTREIVQGKLDEVDELEKVYKKFKSVNKESQDVTAEWNKEYQNLFDWIRVFQDACRIALRERPQLLEKVGILVRSTRPRRKGSPAAGEPASKAPEGTENPAPDRMATQSAGGADNPASEKTATQSAEKKETPAADE
jgi:hypothetical protein